MLFIDGGARVGSENMRLEAISEAVAVMHWTHFCSFIYESSNGGNKSCDSEYFENRANMIFLSVYKTANKLMEISVILER